MSNIFWVGALLLFGIRLAHLQNPSVLVQSGSFSPNILSLNINTKRSVHSISDHFLSITLEPSTIFSAFQNNHGSTAINMAKGLNPAYVRISGPECNYFRFQEGQDTSSQSHPVKHGKNITITDWHWSQLNDFVAKTRLDLIVGLNIMIRQHGTWDLSNTLDLISYSDKRGYNMAFQLGNDVEVIGSRIDGLSLGKDVNRLRKVLEAFPRYMNSPIISPDVKSCESQEEARYLKNFITESGSSLSAITYQVPFSSEKSVENPTDIFNYVQNQLEVRVWQKDSINKYLGRIGVKKPLWIIESGNKDRRGDFMDGLIWAQRLCAGAKVGINVIMRKPSLLSLREPTPDYWVSVLHKALIGSEVLDIKILTGNKTRIETVAHCTKMSPFDPNEGILAPEYRYNRGAITVFGVNMGSESVKISLKTGEKQSLPLHQYFLTASSRQNGKTAVRSLSTLLNGQKLMLSSDDELPILSPKIRGSHQVITIPSQSVFFLVLPDIKSRACTAVQIEESKESFRNGGKIIDQEEFDTTDYDTPILDQEDEPALNEKNNYVAFRPKYIKTIDEPEVRRNEKQKESNINNSKMSQNNGDEPLATGKLQPSEPVVKYVTFSNNNWLSKFPKSLKNQEYFVEPSTLPPAEVTTVEMQTEKSVTPHSKREKYHILAQAVAGKRHPEKNVRSELHSNLDSALTSLRPLQKIKVMKRSVVDSDNGSEEVKESIEDFTNKEDRPSQTFLTINETSSVNDVILESSEEDIKSSERPKKEVIKTNPAIPDVHQLTVTTQSTPQTTITSTPTTLAVRMERQRPKLESYVQKIKSRKEQALAKMNEKNLHKTHGKRLQDKNIENNSVVHESVTEKSVTSTEAIIAGKEQTVDENTTTLIDKIRYNRQANNKTTDGNLKTIRPRVNWKSKKSEKNLGIESDKVLSSSVNGTGHFETGTTEMPASSSKTKLRSLPTLPKTLKLSKPKAINGAESKNNDSVLRDSHETTQQLASKLKYKPVLHPLGKVRTPPNIDAEQIVTNGKVIERLIENIKDGRKILQSEHIVSPIDKNGENKQETKTIPSAGEKIKALEEKYKNLRSEVERKLHDKLHKVNKRSPSNELIADDIIRVNNILESDTFGSNELNNEDGFAIKHEVARYPRGVADFTVKLNEVNTYVDKNKKNTDPKINDAIDTKTNEITEDDNSVYIKGWKITNDIRQAAADNSEIDSGNTKLKRKSIFKDSDEDNYSKTEDMTTNMVNTFFSHMKLLWKYIKKTFKL